jgi:hypothetical protein
LVRRLESPNRGEKKGLTIQNTKIPRSDNENRASTRKIIESLREETSPMVLYAREELCMRTERKEEYEEQGQITGHRQLCTIAEERVCRVWIAGGNNKEG